MKPGWKTSEFYIVGLAVVGLVVASLASALPSKWAAIGTSVAAAAYAISRGLAKMFPPKQG